MESLEANNGTLNNQVSIFKDLFKRKKIERLTFDFFN